LSATITKLDERRRAAIIKRNAHRDGLYANPTPPLDDERRRWIRAVIVSHGFAVIGGCAGFRPDRLIVSHTVGMTQRGLPELVISGIPQDWAHAVLTEFIAHIPEGEVIPPDEDAILVERLSSGYPGMARPLPKHEANVSLTPWARDYYGREVDVWQMVIPDRERRWPWDPRCKASFRMTQTALVDWIEMGPPNE
jgi:hypothetical protein